MADKKTTKKPEKVEKPSNRVVVKIPKARKGEEKFITASVNGKVYKILKGVAVEIPRELAEVLNNADAEALKADMFAEKIVSDTLKKEETI